MSRSENALEFVAYLMLFMMGEGLATPPPPPPPTHFFPVTYTNVGISPQTFLTFSFNLFATLVQTFTFVSSASPKLLNLNQDHPSKMHFFCSNPYKIRVVITSLMKMLELPTFDHMNLSTIKFCWRRHWQKL